MTILNHLSNKLSQHGIHNPLKPSHNTQQQQQQQLTVNKMSIRVVGAGKGFEISTGNVDEGQNVNYKYNGQDASFTVNGFNDQERRRGWSQPGSGHNDVLAWRVDNTVVLMRKPGQDFMGQLPDNRSLADVTLAGTHESTSITGGE